MIGTNGLQQWLAEISERLIRLMKSIVKNQDGTYTVVLYLKEDERKQLKKLAESLGKNDFETIKYAIRLISWWSKNLIEPEA